MPYNQSFLTKKVARLYNELKIKEALSKNKRKEENYGLSIFQ